MLFRKLKLNKLAKSFNFIVIFCALFLVIFCNLENIVLLNTFNIENLSYIFSLNNRISPLFSIIFFRSLLLIIPAITFTLIELFLNVENKKNSLKSTSIGKIFLNKNKDDLWYWGFLSALNGLFRSKFPFIIFTLTLGVSNLTNSLENKFNQIYDNIFLLPNSELMAVLVILLGFILFDLIFYIKHYLWHTLPFLWDLHEFHHSAPQMTILSLSRKSFLIEDLTSIITIPIYVLTALTVKKYLSQGFVFPVLLFLFLGTMSYLYEQAGHSSYKIIYPKPISYIFMSPSLHWIHHSDNPKHYNKNLGLFLTLWDKVFKTYLDESHLCEIESFGVRNSQYNNYHPLYSMTILPLVKISKRIKKLITI